MSITMVIPSRGRPERAQAMIASASELAEGNALKFVLCLDADDPSLEAYLEAFRRQLTFTDIQVSSPTERLGYTAWLNRIASVERDYATILGAFGDDVLFRTPGWDRIVEEALQSPAIAYGDDLIHGKNHPSAVWMHSSIAKALGWLALPATSHQWADDGWKRLGQELGLLRFLPDVVVEHMHPAVGKAEWDTTYAGVFESDRAKADYEGFTDWAENGGLQADAAKVREALAAVA